MSPEVLEVAGKIVVLRSENEPPPEALMALVNSLRDAGAQLVMVCAPGADLQVMDEQEMAETGWACIQRGGSVETWLKGHRDGNPQGTDAWNQMDRLLDELRERADYGLGLLAPLPQL